MQHSPPDTARTTNFESHDGGALPSLELPPVPFGRTAAAPDTIAPAPIAPQGTSIDDLIGSLTIDGFDRPVAPPAEPTRPHHEFSVAVERRSRSERRREQRTTPDRRAFTSANLVTPASGPSDPRPTTAAPYPDNSHRAPIDPVMPPLPIDEHLQPARAYELPNRGIAATTQRSTRPSLAAPAHPPTIPLPPQAPAIAPQQPAAAPPPPVAHAVANPSAEPQPSGIEGIFGPPRAQPTDAAAEYLQSTTSTDHVPAESLVAPGAGLHQVVATVAADPAAWHGRAAHVDDAMLVWNSPGAQAPLAPSVAAMVAPAPPASAPATTGTTIATAPLAPAPASAATTGRASTPLRVALMIGIPATAGIAIAFAIERFLL